MIGGARSVLAAVVLFCTGIAPALCGGAASIACAGSAPREMPADAPAPAPAREPQPAPAAAPVPASAAAPQPAPVLYGAPLDPATPSLTLAQLLAAPAQHAGQTVRTRGTIARVCQRMGCWMELQADDAPSGVRVPMADHAYFLPQTVVGRRAEIQGKVSVAALSDGHKRHLLSEGAQATDVDLSIAATGVSVGDMAEARRDGAMSVR